jgi:hypothetical protein
MPFIEVPEERTVSFMVSTLMRLMSVRRSCRTSTASRGDMVDGGARRCSAFRLAVEDELGVLRKVYYHGEMVTIKLACLSQGDVKKTYMYL